jgi:hypothetical protein
MGGDVFGKHFLASCCSIVRIVWHTLILLAVNIRVTLLALLESLD